MKAEKTMRSYRSHNTMSGLVNFIAEMRECRSGEQERARVNKELANIRKKFRDSQSGYQTKKYVAKLLYMSILGYDVDFGLAEAMRLLVSTKYSEKQMGYLAISLLLGDSDKFTKTIADSIRMDLNCQNELFNCMALNFIANVGNQSLSEIFIGDIFELFSAAMCLEVVQQKAGLCLLRIYRKFPELVKVRKWAPVILEKLDSDNLGVNYVPLCMVKAFCQVEPKKYVGVVQKAISILNKIVTANDVSTRYVYYNVPAPWVQVILFRILQYYPAPNDQQVMENLERILGKIISDASWSQKNVNQNNAANAVFIEAINYSIQIFPNSDLIRKVNVVLISYLNTKSPNSKYLALETMSHIAATGDSLGLLDSHRDSVMIMLKDSDISIQKRALDLLYGMCKQESFKDTINGLLNYLVEADPELKEEMVLKIAVIAEKYVSEYTWYVDAMIRLISIAGDVVGDSLWHRVIQIVLSHEDLREYAAYTLLQALKRESSEDVATKIGAYILGEYGYLIIDSPQCSPFEQFAALHQNFTQASNSTKAIILNTYLKFSKSFPALRYEILNVYKSIQHSLDPELQQRACEYLTILEVYPDTILLAVCEEMPPFAERDSELINNMTKKLNDTDDLRTWIVGGLQDQTLMLKNRPRVVSKATPLRSQDSSPVRSMRSHDTSPKRGQNEDSSTVLEVATSSPMVEGYSSVSVHVLKLLTSQNGVLFEDNCIQIGIKSEYNGSNGKLGLYIGNKMNQPLVDFKIDYILNPPHSVDFINANEPIFLIPSGSQQVFLLKLESRQVIETYPKMLVTYRVLNEPFTVSLYLPINLFKFSVPCKLDGPEFIEKWKQLSNSDQEFKVEISPKNIGIDLGFCKNLFLACNMEVLSNIDTNPNNICCASIFMGTDAGQIGFLLRLESNIQFQKYRATVRASRSGFAKLVGCELAPLLEKLTP